MAGSWMQRLGGTVGAGLFLMGAASCGGDEEASCGDRFVDLANSDAAVTAAADPSNAPASLMGDFTDLQEACGEELENLSESSMAELLDRMDPKVAALLGAAVGG